MRHLLIALCLTAGCAPSDPARVSASSPTLKPISITRLEESDSVFIGRPVKLAVSARGDYFVAEATGIRVLHYDASGRFLDVIGGYGYGPDEFVQPAFLVAVDDSTLLISDQLRRDVILWDLQHHRARLRLPYSGMPGFYVVENGAITGTVYDPGRGTIATRWRLPSTQGQQLGTLPAVFMRNNFFAIYGQIPLAVFRDSVAYVTGNSDFVRIADSTWTVRDSVPIPRRLRRGIPEVIDSTMGNGRNIYYVMNQLSNAYELHRLSGNRYAVIHVDGIFQNSGVTGSLFLTVVEKGKRARCIDLPLPVHDDNALARVTFRGDTLYVLDHFVEGAGAIAEVQKIVLSRNLC